MSSNGGSRTKKARQDAGRQLEIKRKQLEISKRELDLMLMERDAQSSGDEEEWRTTSIPAKSVVQAKLHFALRPRAMRQGFQ